MLQNADKLRLEKVLSVLKRWNYRFPNAQVVKETGENKGNVSAYLSGKKPMSDNFFKTFLEKFDTEEKADSQPKLHVLIDSNLLLAQAQMKLADSNAQLTEMLKASFNNPKIIGNQLEDILSGINATIYGVVDSLALVASGKKFSSPEIAANEIHKHISERHKKAKSKDNLQGVGN